MAKGFSQCELITQPAIPLELPWGARKMPHGPAGPRGCEGCNFQTIQHLVPRVALFYYYVLGLVGTLEIYSNRFFLAAVKLVWIGNAR